MINMGKQKGLTMWGIAMIILIGLFFLFLFFKLFPPYMEDAQIGSALRAFATSHESRNLAPEQALEAIQKRFDIENVRNATANRDIKIVPDEGTYAAEMNYDVEIEMVGNISVLLDFEHRVKVR